MLIPFLLLVIAVVAYMLGGLNGAIIASKTLYRNDVRRHGSHNAGLRERVTAAAIVHRIWWLRPLTVLFAFVMWQTDILPIARSTWFVRVCRVCSVPVSM